MLQHNSYISWAVLTFYFGTKNATRARFYSVGHMDVSDVAQDPPVPRLQIVGNALTKKCRTQCRWAPWKVLDFDLVATVVSAINPHWPLLAPLAFAAAAAFPRLTFPVVTAAPAVRPATATAIFAFASFALNWPRRTGRTGPSETCPRIDVRQTEHRGTTGNPR